MSDYPELTEKGREECEKIIARFKKKMVDMCEETLSHLYTDVSIWIESDAYVNLRGQIMSDLSYYRGSACNHESDLKKLRDAIYKSHRGELIKDLNQDNIEEIKDLKEQIQSIQMTR